MKKNNQYTDGKCLTLPVSLAQKKIVEDEALILVSADNSSHSPFDLLNIAHQFNFNTRIELICRDNHGLAFRRMRLF
jgi:hypothetical protein